MGLDIKVVDESDMELYSERIGAYSFYSRFRHALQSFIMGGKSQQDLAMEQSAEMLKMLTGNDKMFEEFTNKLTQPSGRVVPSHPKYNPAKHRVPLKLFIEHSDCDGEFKSDQCKSIATMLRCFKKTFKQRHPEFKKTYDVFVEAFATAAKNKNNKLVYC